MCALILIVCLFFLDFKVVLEVQCLPYDFSVYFFLIHVKLYCISACTLHTRH